MKQTWPDYATHTQWAVLQDKNPELRELKSFIINSEPAWPSPWRGTASLCCWTANKPALYSRGRHSLSFPRLFAVQIILEKAIQNKGSQCFCLQDVQKLKTPTEKFPDVHSPELLQPSKHHLSAVSQSSKPCTLCWNFLFSLVTYSCHWYLSPLFSAKT